MSDRADARRMVAQLAEINRDLARRLRLEIAVAVARVTVRDEQIIRRLVRDAARELLPADEAL